MKIETISERDSSSSDSDSDSSEQIEQTSLAISSGEESESPSDDLADAMNGNPESDSSSDSETEDVPMHVTERSVDKEPESDSGMNESGSESEESSVESGSESEESDDLAEECKAVKQSKKRKRSSEKIKLETQGDQTPDTKKQKKTVDDSNTPSEPIPESNNKTVYVQGIKFRAKEKDIEEFFNDCGKIVEIRLQYRPDGRSKGSCFIEFSDNAAARNAVQTKNKKEMMERYLEVSMSRKFDPEQTYVDKKRDKPAGCNTVFVGSLHFLVTSAALKKTFEECGSIKDARIMTKSGGDSKGYGYVEFEDSSSVDAAMALAGNKLRGRAFRVDFASDRPTPASEGDGIVEFPSSGRGFSGGRGRGFSGGLDRGFSGGRGRGGGGFRGRGGGGVRGRGGSGSRGRGGGFRGRGGGFR
eukprot:456205_1